MNLVSIIVDAILKAISYIVSAIVFIGKPIIESLYNGYISKYLLSPALSNFSIASSMSSTPM